MFRRNYLTMNNNSYETVTIVINYAQREDVIDVVYMLVKLTALGCNIIPIMAPDRTSGVQSAAYRRYYGLSLTNRNYIAVMLFWLVSALRGDCSVCAISPSARGIIKQGLRDPLYTLNRITEDYSITSSQLLTQTVVLMQSCREYRSAISQWRRRRQLRDWRPKSSIQSTSRSNEIKSVERLDKAGGKQMY